MPPHDFQGVRVFRALNAIGMMAWSAWFCAHKLVLRMGQTERKHNNF